MTFLKGYAGVIVSFLVIDLVWISRVVRPMYERDVGALLRESPRMGPAAAFYLLYAAGVVYFAVLPAVSSGSIRTALLHGALFGALAYGTFAFTNYAVLDGWTWKLVVADVAWGFVLTAVTAACGFFTARLGG